MVTHKSTTKGCASDDILRNKYGSKLMKASILHNRIAKMSGYLQETQKRKLP
jgi:hypothetical protein